MKAARALIFLAMVTTGCDRYGVVTQAGPVITNPPNDQRAYASDVTSRDLYTVLWADVTPPSGASLPPCSDTTLAPIFRSRKRAVTITAKVAQDVPALPIYAATQDGTAACSITYGHITLTPRQVLSPEAELIITQYTSVNDSNNERMTEYLTAAASFASLLAPANPAAKAIAGGINAALATDAGKKLSAEANAFMSSQIVVAGPALIKLDPPIGSGWFKKEITHQLGLQRYGFSNNPNDEPAAPLGSVTITAYRTSTIIGEDPISEGKEFGSLPTYKNVGPGTEVSLVVVGETGAIAQTRKLYGLLNDDASAADVVWRLPASATANDVQQACLNLRKAINKLKALNRLDASAYLWNIYANSSYAKAHETSATLEDSNCLSEDEVSVVRTLKLEKWLRGQPQAAPLGAS